MGAHDEYGKRLLREVAEDDYEAYGPALSVDYGAGLGAQIDGVVAGGIAVEIEARVSKQVRGAVLDLICHPCDKKLLVILPTHAQNPELTAIQCRNILARFVRPENFRVVVTQGHGHDAQVEADAFAINNALRELGYASSRETT